jgi:hypothetical protein
MDEQDTKKATQSKTIVAASGIFILAFASLLNIDLSEADAQDIAQACFSVVTAVLSIIAVYGRYVASQKID